MGYHGMGSQLRGDPGFPLVAAGLGLLARGGVKAIGRGLMKKLAKPAVAKAIGTTALGAAIGRVGGRARPTALMPGGTGPGGIPLPGHFRMRPGSMLPGGRPGIVSETKPSGFHWSEKAGRWVKNRRMNVVNSRALRRAIRRVSGFGKLVKRARGAVGRAATAVGVRRGGRRTRGRR